MSSRIIFCLLALGYAFAAPTTRAENPGIEVDLEEDRVRIEFPEPMRVLENAELGELLSSVPARRYVCVWDDDTALGCEIEGDPLPPATPVTLMLAKGLQTAAGKSLPQRTIRTESDRPRLRASIRGWEGARPRIVIESERALALDAAAGVLRLRSNGREWSNPSLQPLSLADHPWLKSRFALTLPDDIDAGAEVELRVVPGLRTTEGPLPGKQNAQLLRFVDREPFHLRTVSCAGPSRQVQRSVRNGRLNTFCVPGEPVWLTLSSPLDAAGRSALAAMLPKALTIEDKNDASWWPGARANDDLQRRPGAGIQLRLDAPLATETFDLGATLRDDQGRTLSPVRMRIATSEARPQLQAAARALLLGDPARDPIRSVNAGPVELRVAALAAGFSTETVNTPDARGDAASVNADASVRALAGGGWAQWRHGEGETMQVVAPQFELSAYATRRELVAWTTEWKGGAAIAGAAVELLLHIDGEPPRTIVAGRSDRDGLLRLRLPEDVRLPAQQRGVPPPRWLLRAQTGARRAVLPLDAVQGYGLNLGVHRIDTRLWGVADRPLYRAGDTVRYRLWLRARDEGRLMRMPETAPVELSLYFRDEDKTLRTWTATPDDLGGLVGEERLPQHLVDGNYCIRLGAGRGDNDVCFFVGTYRAQDLWAEARAEDRVLRDGDTFVADIAAGYYSGGGAADVALGRVTTMLTGLPLSSAYPAYADYGFIDVDRGAGRDGVSLRGETRNWGKLDHDGKKRIELPLAFDLDEGDAEKDLPAFGRLQLTAEVMLEARESTTSNAAQARYARYARYVGLRIAPRWFDATTPLRLDGVVIDADGHAQAGAAIEVVVEYLPGFGGDGDKDAKRETIARCALLAGTESICDFPRKRSGRYVLTARSGDAAPVEIERYVWSGGSDGAAAQRLAIEVVGAPATPDAPARLLLKSPYARALALIVIESEGALLDSRVIAIDGGAQELLLPLRADGRSRVNVHALVRERADAGIDANGLRLPAKSDATSVSVVVPRPQRAPQLALTLDEERIAPAQVLRIRLRNGGSTPRTATVAVLDDAVRALGAQWWSAFDPQGERWLGMRADEWSNRPFLAGFRDWNRTPWQRRLPWPKARQPAEEAAQPDGVDAAAALPGEPPPVAFDDPSPVDEPMPASAPAAARARADGDARASTIVQQGSFAESGDALDSVVVTGSRISRVDAFAAGEGPSPVLAIDRAKIDVEGSQSIGDALPVLDNATPRDGQGRLDIPPRGRDVQRTADAKALFGARLRHDFADTALWQPDIRLAPGETRVIEFTVPDNLTRWRAVAWSSDADDGFEMAEATFEVGLPLEVRLQAPVRIYPGDRADLVANVRQSGDRDAGIDATVQVETLGVDATRTLALASRGQTTLPLRIAPVDADLRQGDLREGDRHERADGASRTLTAVAAARSGDDRDAVSASIELASPTIEARKVQAGWLGATPLRLDAPTLPRSASDVALRVSLLPGADALVHQWIGDLHAYPHRCWEQILSRGVAAAIAMERGDGERFPDAKTALEEVIGNIAVFQGENGAFRYFADGEDPGRYDEAQAQHALTAYSVRALRLLGEMGHAVPGEALDRGERFLQRRSRPSGDGAAQGNQTAFVAAAQTQPGRDVLDGLWRQWATLGLPAQVATARAMLAGRHPAAAEAVAKLRDATRRRGEARSLRSDVRYDRWMSSDLREQCEFIGLLFDFPEAGDAALRRSLIAGLGDLYAGGFAAVDTQTGASCLIALRALGKRKPDDAVALDIAHGEERGALRLEPGAPAQHWQRGLTTNTAKAPLQLTPRVEGDAPASYVAEFRYRENVREAGSTAVGFALTRRYEVLRERGWAATGKQTLRDGDWLRVTLTLDTAADRYFVAITDAVPGGLRPTDLALSGVAGLDLQKVSGEGSGWFRTRRLDPRAPKFYAEFLPAGRHEVHYFARVGNTGDYLAAPAVAELMYGESTRARTAAARIAIEATIEAAAVSARQKTVD